MHCSQNKPFFTIIIPMHNVQNYIQEALESCINQSFSSLEILVIDDCGTDDSRQIAENLAQQDKRIQIIKNPTNLGLFHTRLEGIKNAKGEYVLFVDGDDSIELDACERIEKILQRHQNTHHGNTNSIDLLCFPSTSSNHQRWEEKANEIIYFKTQNPWKEIRRRTTWSVWGKVYKRTLLLQVKDFIATIPNLPKINMAEDALYFFLITLFVQNAAGSKPSFYHYRQNPHSITQNSSPESLDQAYQSFFAVIKTLKQIKLIGFQHPFMHFINKIKLQTRLMLNALLHHRWGGGKLKKVLKNLYTSKNKKYFFTLSKSFSLKQLW